MSFLKKVGLGVLVALLIIWGGAGTQSHSALMQGGGFLSLLISLVVLYIFTKMAFRVFGFFPAIMILGGIIVFILYAIGAFNNGVDGIGESIKSFLGQKQEAASLYDQAPASEGQVTENFPKADDSGSGLFSSPKQPDTIEQNFEALPKMQGTATVVSASKLIINGKYFVLYGIDAPDATQTCADDKGRAYNCGQAAARWLRSWVNDFMIECRVMKTSQKGSMLGTCSLGEYDIGAALVNAGWAVAYTAHTDIYKPYEGQAQTHKRGLWQGKFYMPWDWRRLQSRRPKIQVIAPEGEGFFGF